jgi:serine protease AprX
MKRFSLAFAFLLSLPVVAAAAAPEPRPKLSAPLRAALEVGGPELVWVYFTDKGPSPAGDAAITPRARARRLLRGTPGLAYDARFDAPLHGPYVDEVTRRVTRVRHASRWLGALSVEATAAQVRELEALPFVARLDVVRRFRGRPEPSSPAARATSTEGAARVSALDYGTSLNQVAMLGVPEAHDLGLHGEGVIVAVLDSGFDNLAHEAFAATLIANRRDFVNGDDDVADGIDQGEGSHGTATLSTIGGYRPGELIGPAFAATYLLAKTENTFSESHVEEDNWAAAAEWAEAQGADVISSSLGYLTMDDPATSYTPAQMDGRTAVVTIAAEMAVARGVVVVNSAGNEGFDPTHNTLGAPADGAGVIAAAAVNPTGSRAFFSSVGPSADGRIKPDVAAQGSAVKTASSLSPTGYQLVNGTSFSCPLTAGVAALVLQARPTWTPAEVADALRRSGSQATAPDNLLGYGIVNVIRAIQ